MTIRIVFCLNRLPSLTHDEFLCHWRDRHAPLVRERAGALGILRYEQSYPVASTAGDILARVRSAPPGYDGVASLWFAGETEMRAAGSTPEGRQAAKELLEDERRFIDLERSPIWLAWDNVIVG